MLFKGAGSTLCLSLLQRQLPPPCVVVVTTQGLSSPFTTGLPTFHGPLRSPLEDIVSSFMRYGPLGFLLALRVISAFKFSPVIFLIFYKMFLDLLKKKRNSLLR